MGKIVFSSDQLPPHLTDRQRYSLWYDLYRQNYGDNDFEISEAPFAARATFVQLKGVVIGSVDLTLSKSDYDRSRARRTSSERLGLLFNAGATPVRSVHRGREEWVQPGGALVLSNTDASTFEVPGDRSSWLILRLPQEPIVRAAPRVKDLVGTALESGNEALRMMTQYTRLVVEHDGFTDPLLTGHIAQTFTDLMTLAIGAQKDAAAFARERGLKRARLDAILREIATDYANPDFTVAALSARLRLSVRYVQDILHATGLGFADRVLELRLQRACDLLARSTGGSRKVSDIAYSCGFNDLSYFHRCFRRRFGMTPAGARSK
jgi:AraC-like DNA-binding protein